MKRTLWPLITARLVYPSADSASMSKDVGNRTLTDQSTPQLQTTDVAGFLRTYACSGCNLAEAMELGPPTPEELLRRGFQSVTFLAYEASFARH